MAKNKSVKDEVKVETNIYSRYNGESYRVKKMHLGHQIDQTFDTLEEAQLFLAQLKTRQATDPISTQIFESIAIKKVAASMTLDKALEKYELEESSKKKGYSSEKSRINRLRKVASDLNLSGKALLLVDREDVNSILAVIRAGKPRKDGGKVYPTSNDNLLRYITILRHMFNIAKSKKDGWNIPMENPIERYSFDFPEPNAPRDRRLNDGEWEKIKKALTEADAKDVFLFVTLMVETGMRNGEVMKTTWENVNTEERSIYLPAEITKTNNARHVALSIRAVNALKALKKGKKTDTILPASLTEGRIYTQWRKAMKAAGIKDLRVYDLRHEAISTFAENPNLTTKQIEKQAGHTDPRMTARYIKIRTKKFGELLD